MHMQSLSTLNPDLLRGLSPKRRPGLLVRVLRLWRDWRLPQGKLSLSV